MIDIHSHILPGLDDGPDALIQSVQMVKHAHAQSITILFATPHSMDGVYSCTPQDILRKCASLTDKLKENQIPVRIIPGSEIRLTHDLISLYDKGSLLTLNNQGTHLLVELPPLFIVEGVSRILRQLAERGIIAIIAHPERNMSIMKNLNILSGLIYDGALMQITATSLMGGFGKRIMTICEKMIDKDVVSFIGSDIHPGRRYRMADAYKKVGEMADKNSADRIFIKNPEEILLNLAKGTNYAK